MVIFIENRSNGFVNMDVKKLGICLESLSNLSSLSLNLSSNVINDAGSTLFFYILEQPLEIARHRLEFFF